jgi:hypothetical protein
VTAYWRKGKSRVCAKIACASQRTEPNATPDAFGLVGSSSGHSVATERHGRVTSSNRGGEKSSFEFLHAIDR